ncbi:MAG TPA: SdrD B-like domain-containing protein [Propionicimonas sp.]|nr:SdrD B-like domain-containing protein [Propionicimonas sp.]HRA05994.1 SdrD B-like domain-containing protein [Propionicimonas sp.]
MLAFLTAVTLSLIGLITGPATQAAAASFTYPAAIHGDSIVFESDDEPLTQGWQRKLYADWSVPDGAKGGDTFGMTLPSVFGVLAATFDLTFGTTSVGSCTTAANSQDLECTLNSSVDGLSNVHGNLFFTVIALEVTTVETVTFTLEKTYQIDLPGEGGIVPQPEVTEIAKNGWVEGTTVMWEIAIPGSKIQDMDSVRIHDELTPPGQATPALVFTGNLNVAVKSAGGSWDDTPHSGGFNTAGTVLDLTLTGPFNATSTYQMSFATTGDDLYEGDIVKNEAEVAGNKVSSALEYHASAGGTGSGDDLGKFSITKALAGSGESNVPDDTQFSFKYTWVQSGTTHEETGVLKANGEAFISKRVPAGTVFTITELTPPAVSGITWSDVAFTGSGVTDNGNGSATLTATKGGNAAIILTNTATTNVKKVSVGDFVWVDTNRLGDQNAGEPGIPGVVLKLTDPDGNAVPGVGPATTDQNGFYKFADLPALAAGKHYTVSIDRDDTSTKAALANYVPTLAGEGSTPHAANDSSTWIAESSDLTSNGDEDLTLDFGFVAKSYALGNKVWIDTDADGVQDAGESALAGVTVSLTKADGSPATDVDAQAVAAVVTGADGLYCFDKLPAGSYKVNFALTDAQKAQYAFTSTGKGTAATDSDANSAGDTPAITLGSSSDLTKTTTGLLPSGATTLGASEGIDPTWDAGVVQLVSIGDYVWLDNDRNGKQDEVPATPVANVPVTLLAANGTTVLKTTTTNSAGFYSFDNLTAGAEYFVKFDKPASYSFTIKGAGAATAAGDDSDVDPGTGLTAKFTAPTTGSNSLSSPDEPKIDAGLVKYNLILDKHLETSGKLYPGDTVTYTLTPKNEGPSTALAGWSVKELLPSNLTLVSIEGPETAYTCDKAAAICESKVALVGGTEESPISGAKITVTAKISDSASGKLRNVAYVDKAGSDVPETKPLGTKPTNNTDTTLPDSTDNDDEAEINLDSLVSVGDYVWYDNDRNGLQNEPVSAGVAGVEVKLYTVNGQTITAGPITHTDGNGYYAFANLRPGAEYAIEFVAPNGTSFTTANVGGKTDNSASGDTTDSDADGLVRFTAPASGNNSTEPDQADNHGIDAGLVKYNLLLTKTLNDPTKKIRLGDTVTYTLTPMNEGPSTAKAGWSVKELLPGDLTLVSMVGGDTYTCVADVCTSNVPLAGGTVASPELGAPITVTAKVTNNAISGDLKNVAYVDKLGTDVPETNPLGTAPTNGTNTTVPGSTDNDAEAKITLSPYVSIGDVAWYDNNRDGLQGDADSAYSDMKVEIYPATGEMNEASRLAVTNTVNGVYNFNNLEASTTYRVKFIKDAAETFTTKGLVATAADDSNVGADGVATVTTPATGLNKVGKDQADVPTIDAGVVRYNLQLRKSVVSSGPYYEGGTVTFELTPSNDGPATELVGWSVTDLLPPGLTALSATGGNSYKPCEISAAGRVVTCESLVALPKGDGAKITVTAKIGADVVGRLHNVAYVSPSDSEVAETIGLAVPKAQTGSGEAGWGTDTSTPTTDNDAQAELDVKPLVSIGDYVWYDTNRNGVQDAGELPVDKVTVKLYAEDGVTFLKSTTTNSAGYYYFDDLTPGAKYVVEFVKPANTVFTQQDAPSDDALDSDADPATGRVKVEAPASGNNSKTVPDLKTIDAGLVKLVSVGDFVWYDTDKDGVQDKSELPVKDVVVNLIDAGKVIATTKTDADGYYYFQNLETTKAYTIEFVKPANTVFTQANAGADDLLDSDADAAGKVNITVPKDGKNLHGSTEVDEDNSSFDAGLVKLVSVGDYVWYDVDRDGAQTDGETAVPDVKVNLYDEAGKLVATTKTDAAGYYAFKDLLAETKYTIEFVKPDGASFIPALVGDVAKDSNADVVTGKFSFTSPKSGSNLTTPKLADDPTIDAGLVKYNLKLTKTRTSEELLYRGETVTFELIPSNDGPVNALAGWSVTELLPSELVLVSMSGAGYQCTANVCASDSPLAAGASGSPITVVAKPGASFKGKVWNVAYVAPATGDKTETIGLGELPTNLTDAALSTTDNDSQDFVRVSRLTAAEAANDGDGDNLAFTGSNGTAAFLGTGLLLLAAGTGLVLARRRRSVN